MNVGNKNKNKNMYRCKECDSTDVEELGWINMNTSQLSDNYCLNVDLNDFSSHFCNQCECNCEVYNDEINYE